MNTYYKHNGRGKWARFYYDPFLQLWTIYQVTAPNDEADQIGEASYTIKSGLHDLVDYVLTQ